MAVYLDLCEVIASCLAQTQLGCVSSPVGHSKNCLLRVFLMHLEPFQNFFHSEQVASQFL